MKKKIGRKLISIMLAFAMVMTGVAVGVPGISDKVYAGTNGYTQSGAVNYANSLVGTKWDVDNGSFDCVDIVKKYFKDIGGFGYRAQGNAGSYATTAAIPNGWNRMYMSNGYAPQPGDVAVWGYNAKMWNYTCSSGHVGIVVAVNGNTITLVDQDSNTQRAAAKNNYRASDVTCYIHPDFASPAPSNNSPVGSFRVAVGGAGKVYVGGWAYDPDDMNNQIAVDVYIGAPLGSAGAEGHRIRANSADFTQGSGANHGFSTWIETSKRGNNVPVYCYAVDTSMTSNTYLSGTCLYVNISDPTYDGFDVNWSLDGKYYSGEQSFGTCDVYIDNVLAAKDCKDYASLVKTDSNYLVSNIKAKSGYTYVGPTGSLVGTVKSGGVVITLNFKTNPKSISDATNITVSNATYTGKALTPTVTVKYGSTSLTKGTDYTVSYTNNKNVGVGKVTITGKGKFTGTVTKTFVINPKGTTNKTPSASKKAFTAKWSAQSAKMATSRITGYQLQYSTSSKFASAKTVTAKGYKVTSKKISGLKAKTKYYTRVRTYMKVGSKTYYSGWSSVKSVKTK